MSQYVSGGAVGEMKGGGDLGGFILTCLLWVTVGMVIATISHRVFYPNPMGYLCPSVEGLAEVKHGRKGRSDYVNGVKMDARECVFIELPHNR
jgi:hypothetical protein